MGPMLPRRWSRAYDVCGSEAPRDRITAGAHTAQEKAKANTKKVTKGCLRAIALTLTRSREAVTMVAGPRTTVGAPLCYLRDYRYRGVGTSHYLLLGSGDCGRVMPIMPSTRAYVLDYPP
jgi:hypothetical protein